MSSTAESKPEVPKGGSLWRAPDGRLCTIQTAPVHPAPHVMQELWSNLRTRRFPMAWDGREPKGALIVWWMNPIAFECGRCRRQLGRYVAYHAGTEYGIVEDTARRYFMRENFPVDRRQVIHGTA